MPRRERPTKVVERTLAGKGELGLVRLFLAVVLSCVGSAAAQNSTASTRNQPAGSTGTSAASAQHPADLHETSNEDDFRRHVEARWRAARTGQIQVYVTPDRLDSNAYEVRVVVTRAPAGSDGMTAVFPSGRTRWESLLKLDDEIRVRITPESAGSLTIALPSPRPDPLIRHLDPGGHAEWNWTVRKTGAAAGRFLLEADVIYRRDFSPAGEPVVSYTSTQTVISLSNPANWPASPHLQ